MIFILNYRIKRDAANISRVSKNGVPTLNEVKLFKRGFS